MVTIVNHDIHTQAVLDLLATVVVVGDGSRPGSAGSEMTPFVPYSVLYSLEDEDRDGPVNDFESDVVFTYQVTSVGETAKQARLQAGTVRETLLTTGNLTVTGRHVNWVWQARTGPVRREIDHKPPLFYAIDEFHIRTTPA